VCRLIYEEKRLYIHKVGGERPTTIRICHSVGNSVMETGGESWVGNSKG